MEHWVGPGDSWGGHVNKGCDPSSLPFPSQAVGFQVWVFHAAFSPGMFFSIRYKYHSSFKSCSEAASPVKPLSLTAPLLSEAESIFSLFEALSKLVPWGRYSLYCHAPSLKTLCLPCQILISPRTEDTKHFKVFFPSIISIKVIYTPWDKIWKSYQKLMKKNHFINPLP